MTPQPDDLPVRVLFVADALSYNGAIRTAVDLVPQFRAAGVPTELWTLFQVEPGREVSHDFSVPVTVATPQGRRFRTAFPLALGRLVRACRRVDVVVSASEVGPALLLSSVAAKLARKAFVIMVHADLQRAIEQWVPPALRRPTHVGHRRADAAICISPGLVDTVLAGGVARHRIHVVQNGIDVEQVRSRASEPPMLAPPVAPRIVSLGRLSPEKGYDLLVRAHGNVRSAGVAHELVLIGDGGVADELRRLADELGVRDSVHLQGAMVNPFPVIAGASAFVLPSRREGLPLALLEALALGVPVIASRCSDGVVDALGGGRFGELVEPESVEALSAALLRHLANPTHLQARADAGQAHAERYDVRKTAIQTLAIISALVEQRAAGRRQWARRRAGNAAKS